MANLVIKPASGSGNKIVFQNQAGLVDAITIEDSGNTTLAGTANNLGTVTGGTITSATTFPAGHVLQNLWYPYQTRWLKDDAHTQWFDGPGILSDGSMTITLSNTTNKILVTVNMQFGGIPTWSQQAFMVYYRINDGSWTDTGYGSGQFIYMTTTGCFGHAGVQFLHNVTTTDDVDYKIVFRSKNSGQHIRLNYGGLNANGDGYSDAGQLSSILLQEVVI